MNEVVLYEEKPAYDTDLVFEQVASHYLDLQDSRPGKRVRLDEAVDACIEMHPEYECEQVRGLVRTKEFDEYLISRRKEHLLTRLVPSLMAAELGSHLGEKAATQLMARLDSGAQISTKDLIAIVKMAYELAAKADEKVEEATGHQQDVQVNVDLKGLLLGLPADMAQDYMAEVGRRLSIEGK